MAEATPRPWDVLDEYTVFDHESETFVDESLITAETGWEGASEADSYCVAHLDWQWPEEIRIANAELIVRAVNSFDALVEVCGKYLADHNLTWSPRDPCPCEICTAASAALAAAKKQEATDG